MPIHALMRILCNGFGWFHMVAESVHAEHDVVVLSADDIRRAWDDPTPRWWRALVPDGWEPDVALFSSPEYQVLPPGLAGLPCPKALWVGDWYINANAVLQVASLADLVLADALGARALRRAGLGAVEVCCPWTFDPALHRPDWEAESLYDVSFVGSLNPTIHGVRNRWVERMLRLPGHHRVAVASDLWGEDYARFLQRSRISFNFSLTRDVNVRCFEAPACGSMMMIQREAEVADWLRPGEECVVYGADDFEDVVAHYLENEDERSAIARAGWARVQEHAPADRLRALVDRLEALASSPRKLAPGRPAELRALAFQAVGRTINDKSFAGIEIAFEEVERALPDDGAVSANRAVLYVESAGAAEPADALPRIGFAVEALERALSLDPTDGVALLNLARIAAATGRRETAAALLRDLIAGIDRGTMVARPDRLPLPQELDDFMSAWLSASLEAAPRPEAELTELLAGEAAAALADVGEDVPDRIKLYERALAANPEAAATRWKLALALLQAGAEDEALEQLRLVMRLSAMRPKLWELFLAVLTAAGREEEARAFASERLAIAGRVLAWTGVGERLSAAATPARPAAGAAAHA